MGSLLLLSAFAGAQEPAQGAAAGETVAIADGAAGKPPAPRPRPAKPKPKADAAKGAKAAEEDKETPPPPPPPPPKPKSGDVITLVDGTVIDGVQIIKESPKEMVLQVISGVELAIPRAQIKEVKRDNITALDVKRGVTQATQPASHDLLPGMKFSGKLSADISKPPAEFKNEDVGVVLTELCKRANVDVVLDPSVEELPKAERRWSYVLSADQPMTLFNLLKDELPKKFPALEALLLKDQIVVATKEAVETLKTQGAIEIPGPDAAPAEVTPTTPIAPSAPPPPAAPAKP
jgi:hypothetical protein